MDIEFPWQVAHSTNWEWLNSEEETEEMAMEWEQYDPLL